MPYIYKNGLQYSGSGSGGAGPIDATSTPIANKVSKFDTNAFMNSGDMSSTDIEDFIENLEVGGGSGGGSGGNINVNDMTSQEVSNFINSLDFAGANVEDYIVEEGTSDIWTYRKWNSGIAECWGTKTTNSVTFSQWSTLPWYYAYIAGVALPFTFAEIPIVTHHCYTAGGDIYVAGGASTTNQGGLPSTTNTGGITLYRAATSTLSITVQYHVIGKWK